MGSPFSFLGSSPAPGEAGPSIGSDIGASNLGSQGQNLVTGALAQLGFAKAQVGTWGRPSGGIDWFHIATNASGGIPNLHISPKDLYVNDNFFRWTALEGKDARLSYSYEFMIIGVGPNGEDVDFVDRMVLPIAPQSIQMNVPTAVNTTVTMKGIVEEHNGAPLRFITMSGTTGVMPAMPMTRPSTHSTGILDFLFANTIKSIGNVVSSAEKIISAFTDGTGPQYQNLLAAKPDEYQKYEYMSGYYFIHSLARFFDFYLAIKKRADGKKYRLVLNMHKDRMYYDVTLTNYGYAKAAGTLEYNYSINLTAWKRREMPAGTARRAQTFGLNFAPAGIGDKIQNAINQIRNARRTVALSYGVMQGIRSDINDSFINPMNQVILLAKDVSNLAFTMLDFAGIGVHGKPLNSLWSGLGAAWQSTVANAQSIGDPYYLKLKTQLNSLGYADQSQAGVTGGSIAAIDSFAAKSSAIQGGTQSDFNPADSSPIMNLLSSPANYPDIFDDDAVAISNLPIDQATQDAVDSQVNAAAQLTPDDLRTLSASMNDFVSSISEALGGGDATYSRVYGRPAPAQTFHELSTQDVELLSALNDILMATDSIIASIENASNVREGDYYDFYADFAVNNGLDFNRSISKFYVPFPHGASLESLSYQYLGDADRWPEIAALNGLKAPYIDEVGFEIPLSATGSGNSVTVPTVSNLYIGQVVQVSSNIQPPASRKIISLDIVSSIESIVTFEDTGQSLSIYKVADQAKLTAFLPNTVNSLKLIAIPSLAPVNVEGRIKLGADVADLNGLARIAKVDFLLGPDGDLVFTSNGDIVLSTGLTNLVQAAMIKLRTKKGSMVQHPDFGSGVEPGTPTSEINAKDVLNQLNQAFSEDARFTGVLSAEVQKQGPAMSVKVLVGVAGADNYLPIESSIPM